MIRKKTIISLFLTAMLAFSQVSIVSANELDATVTTEEANIVEVQDNEETMTTEESEPNTNEQTEPPVDEQIPEDEPIIEEEPVIPPYESGNGKVVQNTPYYHVYSGKFAQAGTLEEGVILTPTRVSTNYFIINTNNKVYYIPKSAFTSTTENSNFEQHLQGHYPRGIIAEIDAPFKDVDGNVLGTITKGEQVNLHMVNSRRGVVELFGKRVYVDLSNFQHTNQVIPNKNIGHKEMEYYLKVFSYMYPEFTELVTLGKSVEGRPIYSLRVGNGSQEIFMDASMHAREHMTTNVLLEMIDQYTYHYAKGTNFASYNVKTVLDRVSIWFVPMMNPDGVTLVQSKANASSATKKLNSDSTNYNRWKANIRGVDLNRNFDGGWATKVTAKAPSYKNYKGQGAFSEPESKALRDFVALRKFKSYISYHSSGSVLYYYHHQKATQLKRDLTVAKLISSKTGYRVMAPTGETGSGASTDWFIMNYKMPGITIEIAPAVGETVVPLKYWDSVWNKNQSIGLLAANEANTR